jgi:hypothetical protein
MLGKTQLFQKLLTLPAIYALAFATTAAAVTGLDPDPEVSTTDFGFSVISIGDITSDGIADLAVGAPFQDGDFVSIAMGYGFPQNVGKVYLVDGANYSILNMLTDPDFDLIQSQHFGGQLGFSLAAVGDLDNDGVTEILAGVHHHIGDPDHKEEINCGKALVFSGKTGTLLFTLEDPDEQEDGRFGAAVAGLGDIDADGVPDMLVGAPGRGTGDEEDEEGLVTVGGAYIFSGKTGLVIRTITHPDFEGAEEGAEFGFSVANAGDVNRDRVSDMIIGAPGEGHVFVMSGATGAVIYDIVSPTSDTLPSFGYSLSGNKDFNRDRSPDFVIGAPLQNGLQGGAYIYNGSDGSLQRQLTPPVPQNYARFGATVLASDDISGDRRPDVVVSAPDQTVNDLTHAGQVYVFDGRRGRLVQTLTSAVPQSGARYGMALQSVDFDGDQKATVIVGTPDQSAKLNDGLTHVQIGQVEIQ